MSGLLPSAFMLAAAVCVGCGRFGTIVDNNSGNSVPAALDLQSCNLMAINEFQTLSDDSRSEYEAAMRAGKIVQLKNGTNVKQDKVLNFEDGHLVIWKPTGEKMTTGEAMRRHIGVYEWVDPLEGPYQGRPVCVSFTMLHGKSPLP